MLCANTCHAVCQFMLYCVPIHTVSCCVPDRFTSLMLDHVEAPDLPADRVLAAVLSVRDSIRLSDGRYPNMTVSLPTV